MAAWRGPELDAAAAEALAVVTLYATGRPEDSDLAGRLLDGTTAEDAVRGLVSVCSTLLVMLEFETGQRPAASLAAAGRLIAQATLQPS
jgi:hypothetical protein